MKSSTITLIIVAVIGYLLWQKSQVMPHVDDLGIFTAWLHTTYQDTAYISSVLNTASLFNKEYALYASTERTAGK